MPLVLTGATSGSVTVDVPAVAGTNTLTLPASTGTILTTTSPKAGNVIQVVQTVKADLFTTSSTSYTDITGLSASITPASSTSKILVLVTISVGAGANAQFNLLRNSTNICQSTAGSDNSTTTVGYPYAYSMLTIPISFLDSPATTSSTTYKIQMKVDSSCRINARSTDWYYSGTSSVTLMEIAA